MVTMTHESGSVVVGVDTHADTNTAAVLDTLGRPLSIHQFPTTPAGDQALLAWLTSYGHPVGVGVEGTGSYGTALTRALTAAGLPVTEISRPDRSKRRAVGKSDPIDAQAAARAVLAGTTTIPRARDGVTEAIRVLHTVRRGAVKARTAAIHHFGQMVITAPEPLRAQLMPLSTIRRVATAAGYRPGATISDAATATKIALRRLARRIEALDEEMADAKAELDALTVHAAPELRAVYGVGPDVASQLLLTAGGNPERLTSEASFAALCGTNPLPASSGKTTRHRLNRGGDRQANRVLHVIALCRLSGDTRTQDYAKKRAKKGDSKPEILRCLKRYIARELTPILRRAVQDIQDQQALTRHAA